MPDAARISDFHVCPKVEPGPVPHVGGPIFSGSANVIVGFLPAARKGDSVVCFPVGPSDRIKQGSATVLINHRQAARRTDPAVHVGGDRIVGGCPSVVIGDSTQSFVFRAAAKIGTPFVRSASASGWSTTPTTTRRCPTSRIWRPRRSTTRRRRRADSRGATPSPTSTC
ncbi:PAAR domain-containing protein [Nannocystis pusilla]|uniref:PAAR domain-containing protein n=1 Tax=Nannocystis pusilla TaxID=889268 RepID=UPI003B75D7CE